VINQRFHVKKIGVVVEDNEWLASPHGALKSSELGLTTFSVALFAIAMSSMNRVIVGFIFALTVRSTTPASHMFVISPKMTVTRNPTGLCLDAGRFIT
ncbi:hypothetical protein Q6294_29210, partial [Klebsiella pneumoniae]